MYEYVHLRRSRRALHRDNTEKFAEGYYKKVLCTPKYTTRKYALRVQSILLLEGNKHSKAHYKELGSMQSKAYYKEICTQNHTSRKFVLQIILQGNMHSKAYYKEVLWTPKHTTRKYLHSKACYKEICTQKHTTRKFVLQMMVIQGNMHSKVYYKEICTPKHTTRK